MHLYNASWLSGGAFWREAGLGATLAFATGAVSLLTGGTGEAPEMLVLHPLVDSRI